MKMWYCCEFFVKLYDSWSSSLRLVWKYWFKKEWFLIVNTCLLGKEIPDSFNNFRNSDILLEQKGWQIDGLTVSINCHCTIGKNLLKLNRLQADSGIFWIVFTFFYSQICLIPCHFWSPGIIKWHARFSSEC